MKIVGRFLYKSSDHTMYTIYYKDNNNKNITTLLTFDLYIKQFRNKIRNI